MGFRAPRFGEPDLRGCPVLLSLSEVLDFDTDLDFRLLNTFVSLGFDLDLERLESRLRNGDFERVLRVGRFEGRIGDFERVWRLIGRDRDRDLLPFRLFLDGLRLLFRLFERDLLRPRSFRGFDDRLDLERDFDRDLEFRDVGFLVIANNLACSSEIACAAFL